MNPKYQINRLIYTRKFSDVGSGLTISGKVDISGKGKISAGRNLLLKRGCHIFADKNATITIGNDVLIGHEVGISAKKLIEIGDEARIGDRTVIIDTDWHGFDGCPPKILPVKLGFHVWTGIGVMILKGVTIGNYSIVGAGAVVASDVPANTVVAGNPARQIGLTKSGHC